MATTPLINCADLDALAPELAGESDAAKQLAIKSATAAAERYCRRSFLAATATEQYRGTGHPLLNLDRWPVTSVASVYVSPAGTFDATTLLTADTDYVLEWGGRPRSAGGGGQLRLLQARLSWAGGWYGFGGYGGYGGGPFNSVGYAGLTGAGLVGWPVNPGGVHPVRVTYTAGYSASNVPEDLKMAVASVAAFQLKTAGAGGLTATSQSFIDASVSVGFLTEQLARGAVPALGSAREILDGYRDARYVDVKVV